MKAYLFLIALGLCSSVLSLPIEGPRQHRVSTDKILDLEQQLKKQAGEDKHVESAIDEESEGEEPIIPAELAEATEEDDERQLQEAEPSIQEPADIVVPEEADAAAVEGVEPDETPAEPDDEVDDEADEENTDEYEGYDNMDDYNLRDLFLRALRERVYGAQQYAYDPYEDEDSNAALMAEFEAAMKREQAGSDLYPLEDLSYYDDLNTYEARKRYDEEELRALQEEEELQKRYNLEDLQQYGGDVEAKVVAKKSGYGAPAYYLDWLKAQEQEEQEMMEQQGQKQQEEEQLKEQPEEEEEEEPSSGEVEEPVGKDQEQNEFMEYLKMNKPTFVKRNAGMQPLYM